MEFNYTFFFKAMSAIFIKKQVDLLFDHWNDLVLQNFRAAPSASANCAASLSL